jgi:outer membrane protein OmpA-like peptidoglycan-associated protein
MEPTALVFRGADGTERGGREGTHAESVRSHLVSRGIPSDKIRATGLGSARPVADNATAEGRANNPRVEIVVEPDK